MSLLASMVFGVCLGIVILDYFDPLP